MAASPKIVVLGAGSVGCFIGGAWTLAGLDVSFIGRQSIADDIAKYGINLSDLDGWKKRLPPEVIHFSTKPAALARADIVLICVKSNGTAAAARLIATHAKRKPLVISFQNGVSNPELLRSLLPKLEIAQGMVPFNIVYQGKGRWHKAVSGHLFVEDNDITRALARRIGTGPGQLKLASNMASVAWGKLLLNLNNALNALSGETLLAQLRQRDYRRIFAAAIVETLDLLKAANIQPAQIGPIPPRLLPHVIAAPDFLFRNLLLRVQKIDPAARSSMSDDFAAGRETEVDFLNGEVVKLAERLGRNAPVNRAIVELVKQREAGVEHLWTAENLRKYVLEGHKSVALFGY